jgi:hypothetical protein
MFTQTRKINGPRRPKETRSKDDDIEKTSVGRESVGHALEWPTLSLLTLYCNINDH